MLTCFLLMDIMMINKFDKEKTSMLISSKSSPFYSIGFIIDSIKAISSSDKLYFL